MSTVTQSPVLPIYARQDLTFVRGERTIRAEDPSKTAILGNFRFAYQNRHIDLSAVPWYKLACRVAHSKMNADPQVWGLVEELILSVATPFLEEAAEFPFRR